MVAQRVGDDPAVLLRSYTRRTRMKAADDRMSEVINAPAAGFIGG